MKNKEAILAILLLGLMTLTLISVAYGQQTGASINHLSNTTKPPSSPGSRNDSKGTINTLILTSEQQNMKWKAYVGNISSTFVLDDADHYSIYRWTIDSFSGQVYITRNDSITWNSVGCASEANKLTEDTNLGHTSTASDSVNRTFSYQAHKQFEIGTTTINPGDCFSTATFANDTFQIPSATTPFTEVLLWDTTTSSMIYTTFVENDAAGYRNDTPRTTYDFQAIVPEYASNPINLRYYFYLELK